MNNNNNTPTQRLLPKESEQGVALLTILLLVVSITVVAGAMLASQKIAIRQSGLLFTQDQLRQDVQAGQQIALALIKADSQLNQTDSKQDVWATPIPPYPIGNNVLTIELSDEAQRFNINNLYHDGAVDETALASFKRLLAQLGLEENLAVAILDWQDPDGQVYEDTADESVVYQQATGATGSMVNGGQQALGGGKQASLPNQPFMSVEQLSGVAGMTPEALARLRPYVTATPYYLPINVNTASAEVLSAVLAEATVEQLQGMVRSRDNQPIDSLDTLWQTPPFNVVSEEQRKQLAPLLSVESQAFKALIVVTEGGMPSATTTGQNSDGTSQQPSARQRFATVKISKLAKNSPIDGLSSANSSNNPNQSSPQNQTANNNGNNNDKEIRVYDQRFWAFRPPV